MTTLLETTLETAYAEWSAWGTELADAVDELDDISAAALLVDTLNQQVLNGGFGQWLVNGFGSSAPALLEVLEDMNTHTTRAVVHLVNMALEIGEEPEDPDEFDEWEARMERVDDLFFALSSVGRDALASDLAAYLQRLVEQ